MAYQDYERGIFNTYSNNIKKGTVDSRIRDLESSKAESMYKDYIKKVIALEPRTFLCASTPHITRQEFYEISIFLVCKIFGEKYIEEFATLLTDYLFTNGSEQILDGISLEIINNDNPNEIIRRVEIPNYDYASSIIALLHEFVHYHFQLKEKNEMKVKYYNEILSIYVEKRATELLSKLLNAPNLEQIISETRLETISWHYDVHEKEIQELIKIVPILKKSAQIDFKSRILLEQIKKECSWALSSNETRLYNLYRKALAASYGLGYLYSSSLIDKYKEDEKIMDTKFNEILNCDIEIQELLKYYGISAGNIKTYKPVEKTLEKIKMNKKNI